MNNRVILSLVAFFIACSTWTVQAQKNKEVNMKTSKILVAYFSVTGTTENVAKNIAEITNGELYKICLLYTSPSPRDRSVSRMPSSA